ncbi:ribosome recycling factor domain-containing protein [Desarmillaria tabescens]|uniref:Ribosome recycling factor domain-containing protein n=1 Tax=Armillaria tabescens TaxID=1929756 RepID=A0AA39MZT7_ARMTA|nr:ribosome recycling factor domain-containing protein [Desarmillaria tabescens]KAK0452149.1 ribosome recycling factor domain-containing protein [Desarmillaria tabescens]
MKASVEWLRRDCADASVRAAGRVTPALLANVRFKEQKLEEVATVGVRDGSMLVVTVFDEENLKHVEAAIYDAKIPSITPQRQDTRTLRIPVPKPTLDAKSSVVTAARKKAEDARVQCRKFHQASVKKGKYDKRSIELEVFQDLLDKHIADIDKILVDMKKTLGLSR